MNDLVLETPNRPAIRKFNPGTLQSDEEVIGQFVVREHELRIVLEVLCGNVDTPSCQHVLLVGPRGRGKTMLLARVAAALRTDGALSGRLLPVWFMEESQEIFDLGDFWLEALFYLARECARHHPELSRELRATHDDLTARRPGNATGEHARSTVLEAADRLGRKLVLMVENLQSLRDDVDADFGWKLREVLQSEPRIVLLGTATSRFEGLDDAAQPFFGLFRIVDLTPLTTTECQRLWRAVSGDAVSRREIRPLEILTGGSPRLLVIVAEFARHRSLLRLMDGLVRLIDDHTEYFRGHLEVIPKTERRVYLSVIDLWLPSSSGEIAARSRLDIRAVSTMLGRLVARGAVVSEGSGRKRRYAAAERLYSVYYKLRRERDEAAVVHNLVRFMGVFYGEAELSELSDDLNAETARSPAIREGERQVETGHALQALQTCAELDRHVGALAGHQKRALEWQSGWLRTHAHLARGERPAAMEAFRSVYATFLPRDERMMRQMLAGVPGLIAAGAAERDLVDILSSDQAKSDGLLPLVVALRERVGEAVRAPIEVIEVAADIRERIATRVGATNSAAPGEVPA